jgi:antitoxin (DNA-binding transcriptional repressor) of toxin-antitoxin stability system
MVMKEVKIADLKARLSEYLRQVRRGDVLTVYDRATPIAQLAAYGGEAETPRVRRALGRTPLSKVPLPPPLRLDFDIVELLDEERKGDR